MNTTQAPGQAPLHDQTGAGPPTPIWISHRIQIALVIGAVLLLALATGLSRAS